MEDHLYTHQWLGLSWPVKFHLAKVFNIGRNGTTHTVDNQVVEDGFLPKDLMTVDVPKLQEYVKSEATEFMKLWRMTVVKAEEELGLRPVVLSEAEATQFEKEYKERKLKSPSNVSQKKSAKKSGK